MSDHHHHHDDHDGHEDATAGRTCCGACREGRVGMGACASATKGFSQADIVPPGVSPLAHAFAMYEAESRHRSGENHG